MVPMKSVTGAIPGNRFLIQPTNRAVRPIRESDGSLAAMLMVLDELCSLGIMGGICVRLGKAKPPTNYPKPSPPQTFGIACEDFIFGQAIFYIKNGYILSVPLTKYKLMKLKCKPYK